jgi:hypothetical protein
VVIEISAANSHKNMANLIKWLVGLQSALEEQQGGSKVFMKVSKSQLN